MEFVNGRAEKQIACAVCAEVLSTEAKQGLGRIFVVGSFSCLVRTDREGNAPAVSCDAGARGRRCVQHDAFLIGEHQVCLSAVVAVANPRPGIRPPQGRSNKAFSCARSLQLARRIAAAISGATTFEKPLGSPRFRSVIRVSASPAGSHV